MGRRLSNVFLSFYRLCLRIAGDDKRGGEKGGLLKRGRRGRSGNAALRSPYLQLLYF